MQSQLRMPRWTVQARRILRDVDGLLRGRFTQLDALRAGRIEIPVGTLVYAGLMLGGCYGLFMGVYGAMRSDNPSVGQLVASTVKVPALFLLTLGVTFPSLYVFSALVRSRLTAEATLRLLLAAIGINLALLASFGPVTGFFTLSTQSYPFMVFLNVVFFTVSGIAGLVFLGRALNVVFEPEEPTHSVGLARIVFRVWIFVYAVVGAQMAWILRPFIGTPGKPFTLFRERDSNFFAAVYEAISQLLS